MVLNHPNVLILDKLTYGPHAGWAIGAPKYMERVGWDEFLKRPVGTGPYIVEGVVEDYWEMIEGRRIAKLVANPDYWNEGYPKLRSIVFLRHSPKEALRALIDGHVDLVNHLIPTDTLRVEESAHSKTVKGRDDVTQMIIMMNLMSFDTLPLRDMRVRKALNYAVNRQEMMKYAFKGNALKMNGILTENSGIDLSGTKTYEWNISKARELLEDAGYGDGFKMNLFYEERDHLTARLLKRFYGLLDIEVDIVPINWEWVLRHQMYPNTRDGYSWEDEDWWLYVGSHPAYAPEMMYGRFVSHFRSKSPFQWIPQWVLEPLDRMYKQVLRTRDREKRFEIYRTANQ
jgi:ABC-type transport system substrate-binding protein